MFEVNLGYTVRPCLRTKQNTPTGHFIAKSLGPVYSGIVFLCLGPWC